MQWRWWFERSTGTEIDNINKWGHEGNQLVNDWAMYLEFITFGIYGWALKCSKSIKVQRRYRAARRFPTSTIGMRACPQGYQGALRWVPDEIDTMLLHTSPMTYRQLSIRPFRIVASASLRKWRSGCTWNTYDMWLCTPSMERSEQPTQPQHGTDRLWKVARTPHHSKDPYSPASQGVDWGRSWCRKQLCWVRTPSCTCWPTLLQRRTRCSQISEQPGQVE